MHRLNDNGINAYFETETLKLYAENYNNRSIDEHNDENFQLDSNAPYDNSPVIDKIVLIISQSCNLACRYCFADKQYLKESRDTENSNMKIQTALKVLDVFFNKFREIKSILFFGGEPLLNYNLITEIVEKTIEFCKEKNKTMPRFCIVTNGTLLNADKIKLLENNNFAITVSLDGNEKITNLLRPTNTNEKIYKTVLTNLQMLNKNISNLIIQSTYTFSHIENGYSPLDTARMIWDLGFKRIHIIPVVGRFNETSIPPKYNEYIYKGFKELSEFSILSLSTKTPFILNQSMNIINAVLKKKERKYICTAGIDSFTVDSKGKISSCYMVDNNVNQIGNTFDDDVSQKIDNAILAFKNLNRNKFKCKNCWVKSICFSCYGPSIIDERIYKAPDDQFCSFLKGTAEGALLGLVKIRMNREMWRNFINNCEKGFDKIAQ